MGETKTAGGGKAADGPQTPAKPLGHSKGKLPNDVVLMSYIGSVPAFSTRLGRNVEPGLPYCMSIAMAHDATAHLPDEWRPFREDDARLVTQYGRSHAASE